MSYSPRLSSAFNDTRLRSGYVSSLSGMCSFCTQECDGTCEIALSAVIGKRAVYPTNTGNNQVASEKTYPIDFSHFNINGRVFGAQGVEETYEEATVFNVNLEREYGYYNPVKITMPIILPALIKLNYTDYFAGAAMAGVSCVIGEEARDKDPNLKIENGKIVEFNELKVMLDSFRNYDRGYGQIILQCNVEDDMMGLPEYAIQKHGVEALEYKFGQSAKGVQPVRKLKNREEALAKQAEGLIVYPDPMSEEVLEKLKKGISPNYFTYIRSPLWDEEFFIKRAKELREMGLKNLYFKMAGYDKEDIKRVIKLGSEVKVDMVTFDGAGGGTGYSPCKMMNEWGLPAIMIEKIVNEVVEELKKKKKYIPAITITGGFSSEDQVFKALALGEGNITAVGLCRAAMAAAMAGHNIGKRIKSGDIPKLVSQYGDTVEEIFQEIKDIEYIYGRKFDDIPLGAVGVFSYLNKIAFGLRHFGTLNRKFDVKLFDKSDLIALTPQAKKLIK